MPDPKKQNNDPDSLLTEYKKQNPTSNVSVIGGSNKSNKSTQNSNLQKKYKVENGNSSFTVYRSLGDKNKKKAAKPATKDPIKNLGTVSDGTPFYKSGPLYAHGPDGTHPTDPTKEAKAKAAAEAKKKHDSAGKKYGKATKTKSTKDGVTTYTMSRPWTKKGTGSSGGKDLGPDYVPSAAETARANAAKNSSGVDTRSHTSFNIKPAGIKITPMLPTGSITVPKIPTNTKKTPPPPSLTSFKGKSGTYSLKGIDTSGRGGRKSGSGGGRVCGCK